MNIFHIFKKRKKNREKEQEEASLPDIADLNGWKGTDHTRMEEEHWDLNDPRERTAFIRHNCDKIMEARRNIQEAKIEYGQVGSYLSDMQKIDEVAGEGREQLEDAARNIVALTRERSDFMNRKVKITEEQYGRMEKYSENMDKELSEMKKSEEYGLKIKNDLRQLEKEKDSLENERKEIAEKQYFLKQLSIIMGVLVLSLFLMFVVFHQIFEADMSIPYLLSILFAMFVFFYIFYETQRNKKDMKMAERKENRAITLLNKVKIKHVNNTTLLESKYNRLQVENAMELEYVWKQYLIAKEEERKQRENTKKLGKHSEALIMMLRDFHVSDPEVWIYQATAILDRKEMVEVRHRLNVRRQNIRRRMDYNFELKEDSEKELKGLIMKMPEIKAEMMEILDEYQIAETNEIIA